MAGDGLYGCFGEQWASGSVLKDFAEEMVPKWDSPNAESVLATAVTTSLLMELIGMAA